MIDKTNIKKVILLKERVIVNDRNRLIISKWMGEESMFKKVLSPLVLFLFGLLIFFLGSTWGHVVTDLSDEAYHQINFINIILMILMMGLLIIFVVRKQFKKINETKYKFIYLGFSLLSMGIVTYFWIEYLMWK